MPSVTVKSADREAVEKAVARYIAHLRRDNPEVRRIIWFGSWVSGRPGPRSDVDICLVLSHSAKSPRDRIPDYLPGAFPTGIDLFVYTEEEFARLMAESPGWRGALARGREM